VVFFQTFSNIARLRISVRQQWLLHARKRRSAIHPRWWEHTPSVLAGLTDHVRTFRERLTAKVSRSILKVSDEYQKELYVTHCAL
jgi:hypothetical protein